MPVAKQSSMVHAAEAQGSVFLIADEDVESAERMTGLLSSNYFYIHVRTGAETLRYVGGFSLAGVLLSDTLPFEDGGAASVLDRLVEDGARVVVLSEIGEPGAIARWKERGAFDCVFHPTRTIRRIALLREVIEKLTVVAAKSGKSGTGEGS